MGVCTSVYPESLAFALPLSKDRQRSQPTPRGICKTLAIANIKINISHGRFPLPYLLTEFKGAKFEIQKITFW